MGRLDYTINEQLTGEAGAGFLAVLAPAQAALVIGLVDAQRDDLLEIVETREAISGELRRFMTEAAIDRVAVMSLSERYGELDGAIVHAYATRFAEVGASVYTLYALSAPVEVTVAPSEVNRDVLLAAMSDRTLATAALEVVYTRP